MNKGWETRADKGDQGLEQGASPNSDVELITCPAHVRVEWRAPIGVGDAI